MSIYPFILRKKSWLLLSFGSYSYYNHLHASFCMDLSFQFLWMYTKEHDCWIIW